MNTDDTILRGYLSILEALNKVPIRGFTSGILVREKRHRLESHRLCALIHETARLVNYDKVPALVDTMYGYRSNSPELIQAEIDKLVHAARAYLKNKVV